MPGGYGTVTLSAPHTLRFGWGRERGILGGGGTVLICRNRTVPMSSRTRLPLYLSMQSPLMPQNCRVTPELWQKVGGWIFIIIIFYLGQQVRDLGP